MWKSTPWEQDPSWCLRLRDKGCFADSRRIQRTSLGRQQSYRCLALLGCSGFSMMLSAAGALLLNLRKEDHPGGCLRCHFTCPSQLHPSWRSLHWGGTSVQYSSMTAAGCATPRRTSSTRRHLGRQFRIEVYGCSRLVYRMGQSLVFSVSGLN